MISTFRQTLKKLFLEYREQCYSAVKWTNYEAIAFTIKHFVAEKKFCLSITGITESNIIMDLDKVRF